MEHSEYSVIIIGSGLAGLFSALKLASYNHLPDGILLITKEILGKSNSKYAQGGIVGVMSQNNKDSVELHVNDTLKAGCGLCEKETVEYISELSDEVINDLIKNGVVFDKDSNGNITFTLEAAHSVNRIMHVGGDATGNGITKVLVDNVRKNPNITVLEHSVVAELLINNENKCKGVVIYNELTGEHQVAYSSATVIATGGVGQLYKYTTNPSCATGDGIDLAYNAGAVIRDMEFIQFHPTALALSPTSNERFLISEAVRGEGAKLVDKSGTEFMGKYSDKRELAPRDVVTRAIYKEMQVTNSKNMYLNASIIDKERLLMRFPTISRICMLRGIDISTSPIPVAPAAHYTMGGIKAEVNGRTSVDGLYAIGEVASTGLHGANRLASNSLLECAVSAYELADFLSFVNLEIPHVIDTSIMKTIDLYKKPIDDADYDIPKLKTRLKDIMWNNVGIIRTENELMYAKSQIAELKDNFKRNRKCANIQEYEYRNMLTVAEIVAESAIQRQESRGAHSRSDFKQTDEIAKHSIITNNNRISTEIAQYAK
ncbi:MAG: L-aspartate oxidase [bacterium]|nr:L-aspartate oxidase [bacterium]